MLLKNSKINNFVFDIDGTISSNSRSVDPKIQKQLLRLLDKDVTLAFASARPVRDMLPILDERFHKSLLIGCNGGVHFNHAKLVKAYYFNKDTVASIVSYLTANSIAYILDGDWSYSFSEVFHPFQKYIKNLTDFEVSEHEMFDSGITKILVLDTKYQYQVEDFLVHNKIIHILSTHTKDKCFDITPNINSKSIGLQECGVDMSETIAFGNDYNDFDMLRDAKISVFVGDKGFFTDADIYTEFNCVSDVLENLIGDLK